MTLRNIKIPARPRSDGKPPFPKFEPLHPLFTGRHKVLTLPAHRSKNIDGPFNVVDLGANNCTCKFGEPFEWHHKRGEWTPSIYCSHKIRAMSDILQRQIDKMKTDPGAAFPSDVQQAYAKAVGSRYNMYEVVSAFHKELRRGSVERAVFWGHMLANYRGVDGVLRYMLNIIFEETRDHWLATWLLNALQPVKKHPGLADQRYTQMLYGIALFCASPKKWELPHRMKFLEAEMRGYARLIKEYGRDVAGVGNVIPRNQREKLMKALKAGIGQKDMVLAQYGLKGLQKLQVASIDDHRAWIVNMIWDDSAFMHSLFKANSLAMSENGQHVNFIASRAIGKFGIGYHELNTLIDGLMGEERSAGLNAKNGAILAEPPPLLKLGVAPQIPIYAHDNHTWAGKALLRKYPEEWQPGATQKNYDLRLCGAYMGVVWRHLAFKQHGRIDCEWGEVTWPKWLHETVSNLWY